MTLTGVKYTLGVPFGWLTISTGTKSGGIAPLPRSRFFETETDTNMLLRELFVYVGTCALVAGGMLLLGRDKASKQR